MLITAKTVEDACPCIDAGRLSSIGGHSSTRRRRQGSQPRNSGGKELIGDLDPRLPIPKEEGRGSCLAQTSNAHTFGIPRFPQYSVRQCRHTYLHWYLSSPDRRRPLEIRTISECGAHRSLSDGRQIPHVNVARLPTLGYVIELMLLLYFFYFICDCHYVSHYHPFFTIFKAQKRSLLVLPQKYPGRNMASGSSE